MSAAQSAAREVIVDNEYATLVYYPELKIIHHVLHKPVPGQEFRSTLNAGAEALQKYEATKWLSDDRGNGPMAQEELDWANTDWFPRVAQAGWKFWALVVPESMMARFALKEAVDNVYEVGVRIMAFTEPDEAMDWLTGQ